MPEVGCAGLLVEDTFCGPMGAFPPQGALHLLDDMPVKAGGCAGNVAIDLARQGVSVDVVGCVGNDSAAEVLFRTFAAHRVGYSRVVRVSDHGTSKTIIVLIEGQDRRYLHVSGANRAFCVDHISRDWLAKLRAFYVGGLFALPKLDIEQLASLFRFCRANKVTTVVDVVVPHHYRGMDELARLLPFIDVFVPNEDEARAFTGLTDPFDQLRALRNVGADTVFITRGGQGAIAAQGAHTWTCGARAMKVVDPSGSGDAFTSGVIRSLLRNWSIPQTLNYASVVGASATRAAGTTDSVFSAEEAERFMQDNPIAVTDGH
jgi:sugar/nucleoside kinase (ribokinase family)